MVGTRTCIIASKKKQNFAAYHLQKIFSHLSSKIGIDTRDSKFHCSDYDIFFHVLIKG
jgi:hypothetical protein